MIAINFSIKTHRNEQVATMAFGNAKELLDQHKIPYSFETNDEVYEDDDPRMNTLRTIYTVHTIFLYNFEDYTIYTLIRD